MKRHAFTDEQKDYIKDNVKGKSHEDLTRDFNNYFNLNLKITQINGVVTRCGYTNAIKPKVYALYKGEECLSTGTTKEIASKLGLKHNTVSRYGTPSYRERREKQGNTERSMLLIEIED